jgi:uncharacterized membrane protein
MDKMLVVVFDGEARAYDGLRALKSLDAEGSITLYACAVIAKDAKNNIGVRQAADQGPLGSAVGLFTGSLLGLWAGPLGFAVAAGTGMLGGILFDLARSGASAEFLKEAGDELEPGMVALVAEIAEDWVTPLDARMEALGGKVFRRARQQLVDAQIEAEISAHEQDVATLKAEMLRATAAHKAKIEARLGKAKAKLQAAQDRARSAIDATTKESEAKIALLQERAATSVGEAKAALTVRIERTRAEVRERRDRLQRAWVAANKELQG